LAEAAQALSQALQRHVVDDAVERLADMLVAEAGLRGWSGIGPGGVLRLRARQKVVLSIDAHSLDITDGAAIPDGAASVSACVAGQHLLGSPISVAAIRRVEGFVACRAGRIEGWAWFPGDPSRDPVLHLVPVGKRKPVARVVATDTDMESTGPLSRPRRFIFPATDAAIFSGPLNVVGEDGRVLPGSSADPGAEARAAAATASMVARRFPAGSARLPRPVIPALAGVPADIVGPPAGAPLRPRRKLAVVIPVYRDTDTTLACLDAVHATVPRGTMVIVVDDASPEPALARALDEMTARRRIRLLRHAVNRGFPAAANTGMRVAAVLPGGPDVVLLNSDTLPGPGWIELLRAAVHDAADVGTATPFSNDASILSYPDPVKPTSPPSPDTLAALAARAAEANAGVAVDIPTAVGFCMYVRRECLLQTGLFREDLFAQGYGEENDFCLRARHLGWRHVAVPAAYVAHIGGVSFGASRSQLMARNLPALNRLHPGYDALIAEWSARDPLALARRRLDAALWAEGRRKGAVLLVTHDSGGGVERVVRARCDAIRAEGLRPIVLRPLRDSSAERRSDDRFYMPGMCCVGEGSESGFPALRFSVPEELPALRDLLDGDRHGGWKFTTCSAITTSPSSNSPGG
jgi:GT2 family glycosyltransferase